MLEINTINTEELIALRHKLHAIAEVSGQEKKTAEKISSFLESTNPDQIITEIGGAGILARYQGKKEGPTIMIRCELDALPISEENDFDYVSKNEGTGHKCGHDGHMAIACGLAQLIGNTKIERGQVLLLFQPAEETGEGAQRILNSKKFEEFSPDYVFALHNLPGYGKHQVVIKEGTFAAASIGLIIKLKGQTSHAAHPEEGKSPALAMAHLVQDLSALTQFYVPLDEAAKATVIHARLGERAFGTSPGHAEVMATLRTYEDETLENLKHKAKRIAEGIADIFELELETEWVESFSVTQNDQKAVEVVRESAKNSNFNLLEKDTPFSWSEDFGHFTKEFKGAMFGLGAGRDQPALHASNYDFPDDIIETGIKMFAGIINQLVFDTSK